MHHTVGHTVESQPFYCVILFMENSIFCWVDRNFSLRTACRYPWELGRLSHKDGFELMSHIKHQNEMQMFWNSLSSSHNLWHHPLGIKWPTLKKITFSRITEMGHALKVHKVRQVTKSSCLSHMEDWKTCKMMLMKIFMNNTWVSTKCKHIFAK